MGGATSDFQTTANAPVGLTATVGWLGRRPLGATVERRRDRRALVVEELRPNLQVRLLLAFDPDQHEAAIARGTRHAARAGPTTPTAPSEPTCPKVVQYRS